jgi:hypothetical protein
MRSMCRHCGKEVVTRPRGLGWKCYYTPGVKDRYPSTSKFARRGVSAETNAPSRTPARACPHPPGSEGRIGTLEARAAATESMTHPGDRR